MARNLHVIWCEIVSEMPPIDMNVIWKNVLDDLFHREENPGCVVCKSAFCFFLIPEDICR